MSGISVYRIIIFFTLIIFIVPLPVMAKEKKAGITLLARGSVIGHRSRAKIKLKRRSPIYEKDTIRVGNNGRAQFRMIDQAVISLQENSVLQIKNYKYKKGATTNSALLNLISGGLRTITGAIGKGNKKAYELQTPLATIGVRGTDYEVEIVSNGMYVAVWDGGIHLMSNLKGMCNIIVGRSQPFIFIDQRGRCHVLQQVPSVFRKGHSSNISVPSQSNLTSGIKVSSHGVISPLQEQSPNQPINNNFNQRGLIIDQSNPSEKIVSSASHPSNPIFKVGLDFYQIAEGGSVSNFKQSVGGYQVTWGFWNRFSNSLSSNASSKSGMVWTAYEPTDLSAVSARTGTFRYENVTDSLLKSTSGQIDNLRVQMDVDFESGNVTNGALSANTRSDTWIAVFDGKINAGDLGLQLNSASVINSDSRTPSPPRDASGFIAGDFVGDKAQAVIGSFGLSEDGKSSNHIEGTFLVK